VADLAALGATHATRLARGERREVVVVHVALARDRRERVQLLLHPEHVQRGHAEDLGLAALEDGRAVDPGDHLDLGGERADVPQPAPVDPDAVGQDALADQLLGHGAEGRGELLLPARERLGQAGLHVGLDLVDPALALLLVGDRERLGEVLRDHALDVVVRVLLVVEEAGELRRRLRGAGGEVGLRVAQRLDEGLARLEARGHHLLGGGDHALVLDEGPGALGRLGLDHHDRDVAVLDHAAGHDHLEDRALHLGVPREGDPLTVDERHAHATDRPGEGQTRQLRGDGGGVDREDVVVVVGVQGEDGDDHLDLVAQALRERRTQRAVDEPAGEDRLGAGTALAAEERAGDPPRRVHPLLDVHCEGEEVELVLGLLAGRGGREQHRVLVEVGDGGAGGLASEAPGLEADGTGAEAAVVDDGFGELDLGTFHEGPPFGFGPDRGLGGLRKKPTASPPVHGRVP